MKGETKKEQVLFFLSRAGKTGISGEEIARELQVSRAYVWKLVGALKEEGYAITGTQHKGYVLNTDEKLCAPAICAYLQKPWSVQTRLSVTSTNDVLKQEAQQGCPTRFLLAAERQTAGRGRKGHDFYSPERTGVYFSFLLRPQTDIEHAPNYTCKAAVAVCRAIETLTDREALIKWVNDVYVDGKKVCGILCEAETDLETRTLSYVIVGIGINISTENFPENIALRAGSIGKVDANRLVAEVMNAWDALEDRSMMEEYRQRSYVIGKKVTLTGKEQEGEFLAVDINDAGNLIVCDPAGKQRTLFYGDVSVKTR